MRWLLAGICCIGLSGCGPTNHPVTTDEVKDNALSDVGELYRVYTAQKKKPPGRFADFKPMEPMSPVGYHALERGELIVRYQATLPDTEEGPSKGPGDEVLAYEKDVPSSGGKVLMIDRTIRTMTADEFKAAKLAGTDPPHTSSGTALKR
jgi:hypothetical protein